MTFGLKTHFGGGRSTGFALIYDDEASQRKFEPKYRLIRVRNEYIAIVLYPDDYVSSVRSHGNAPEDQP